jgi:nucleoside-diphosphate-sugar epimerase
VARSTTSISPPAYCLQHNGLRRLLCGGRPGLHKLPVDEDYDADPTDSYGLSKLVGEKIARSFASRSGADIYALRIGAVIEPADYEHFPAALAGPLARKRDAWSCIDVRDLAQIVDLCVEKDGLGFQVFNASNDGIIANEPATWFLARHARGGRQWRANSRGSRPRGPIERRAKFWAFASSTTGENTLAVLDDRQLASDGCHDAARVTRSGRERGSFTLRPSRRLR